jgi:hypothetical protein
MKKNNKNKGKLSSVIIAMILRVTVPYLISCSSSSLSDEPLTEFIYYADEYGLPTEYLKLINEKVSLKYRVRPAYSNSTIYLTDSFDDKGNFIQFCDMDSFEISSVYHESFHAYADLIIKKGICSLEEQESFEKIMEDSLDYYKETSDGRKILWSNYRRQSSEEAMAMHITNLIKYKIVYEKIAERIASDYIYGLIDNEQMERKLTAANIKWKDILDGVRSRGYYNKSFLRWKLPHIIDAKNHISYSEKEFVAKYILPGIDDEIKKPPLTEFIKECKKNNLPFAYLIDINKNHLWEEDFTTDSFGQLSAEETGQIYEKAFDIYREKILIRDSCSRQSENEAFSEIMDLSLKWYSGSAKNADNIYQIAGDAAEIYIGEIIKQKVSWQKFAFRQQAYEDDFNKEELEELKKSWIEAVEGRNIYGSYTEGSNTYRASNAMSLKEKEFILNFILAGINISDDINCYPYSLPYVEPLPAEEEIFAESQAGAYLLP